MNDQKFQKAAHLNRKIQRYAGIVNHLKCESSHAVISVGSSRQRADDIPLHVSLNHDLREEILKAAQTLLAKAKKEFKEL